MFYQTEAKMQGWRALAVLEDGGERLIYVGRSTSHVREGYAAAFAEVLDEEERAQVRGVSLQCWQGAADQGRWVSKSALPVPSRTPPAPRSPKDRMGHSPDCDSEGPDAETVPASRRDFLPFRKLAINDPGEGRTRPPALRVRGQLAP
jgi:hypothetical protein